MCTTALHTLGYQIFSKGSTRNTWPKLFIILKSMTLYSDCHVLHRVALSDKTAVINGHAKDILKTLLRVFYIGLVETDLGSSALTSSSIIPTSLQGKPVSSVIYYS